MAYRLSDILKGLKQYYSAPLNTSFHKFRNGLIYFSVGLIMIYIAHSSMLPSASQEVVVLAGILLSAVGFFIAMMAQVRMIISRIIQFIEKK